jgi:hypothetical protein
MKIFYRITRDGRVFHYERWRGDIFHWHYRLLDAHSFQSEIKCGGFFHNSLLLIVPIKSIVPMKTEGKIGTMISAFKSAEWNGATLAPDFPPVIRGTLFHDLTYECLEEIATAWGWSVPQTRKWSDELFNEVNRLEGFLYPLKRVYFKAVRKLGGITKWLGGLLRS